MPREAVEDQPPPPIHLRYYLRRGSGGLPRQLGSLRGGGVEAINELLRAHGIDFEEYALPNLDADDYETFHDWFESQYGSFEELWTRETDETFHLLFGNRTFLLRFNLSLAKYLGDGEVAILPEYLDNNCRLRRPANIPVWAKNAVYYRDHGRCVLCQRDLSGLLSTDRAVHYDHIVPLKAWGTNDPSNLQLLCDGCNLCKAAGEARTSTRYIPWWEY